MRGLVILLMALDHVRDFVNADSARISPTDLTATFPALFLTRVVTHLCAPSFVLLAGTSAYLYARRAHHPRRFLVIRGLWLIGLEVTVIGMVWTGRLPGQAVFLQVIWALGVSMVVLGVTMPLGRRVLGTIGLVTIAGHNLLDPVHAAGLAAWGPVWHLLHEKGAALPFGVRGYVSYPVIPWVGLMMAGYALGPLWLTEPAERRRTLVQLGSAALVLFAVLRAANGYGDPVPWHVWGDPVTTAMATVNLTKYPPSLDYVLLTLGVAFLLLATMEHVGERVGAVLATYGRVPLFVYVLHLYGAWALAAALDASGSPGLSLPGTYLAWALLMAALYPVCRWFGGVKQRRREWWLSYL